MVLQHGLQFPGHARHRDHDAPCVLNHKARRGAVWVLKRDRPLGRIRLFQVVARGTPADAPEEGLQFFHQFGPQFQRPPKHLRDALPRDVVLRRPQPSGRQHHVRPGKRRFQRAVDPLPVVAHRRLLVEVDPVLGKHLPHKRGVGVHDLAQEQFRPYHDNFSLHQVSFRAVRARLASRAPRICARTPHFYLPSSWDCRRWRVPAGTAMAERACTGKQRQTPFPVYPGHASCPSI